MNKKIVTIVAIVSLIAIMSVMFAGCATVYQKNLERNEYTVVKYTRDEANEKVPGLKDIELDTKYIVFGSKGLNNVVVIGTKAEISKETKENLKKIPLVTVDFQADAILIGTEAAVKAAKGL